MSGSEASLTSNTFEGAIQNVIKFDEELVKELPLPDHYGKNLDAFNDVLQNMRRE